MFQVVARHREHIFFLLINPKCALCEIVKAMLESSHVKLNYFRLL